MSTAHLGLEFQLMNNSTSPSVYVIYTGAAATASCVAMTQSYHQVGGIHTTTMPYKSEDLSSVACMNSLGSGGGSPVKWSPIDYDDLYYPIPASKSLARVSRCFTDPSQNGMWGDYMKNPFISIPQDVSKMDPAWPPAKCTAGFLGAMDPPRALKPAVSMVPVGGGPPVAADPQSESVLPVPTATAVPGQPIPAPIPIATSGPTSQAGDPSQNPGSAGPGNNADPGTGKGADPPADPAKAAGSANSPAPVAGSPNNGQPSAAPVQSQNGGSGSQANQPQPDPNNGANLGLQAGPGQSQPDPNNLSPAQMSALHQALQPSTNPVAPNIGGGSGSDSQGKSSGSPVNGPNSGSNGPAAGASNPSNNQSPDTQLQPISSAIFGTQAPGNNQQPNAGPANQASGNIGSANVGPANTGSGSGGSGNGAPGSGGSGAAGSANVVPVNAGSGGSGSSGSINLPPVNAGSGSGGSGSGNSGNGGSGGGGSNNLPPANAGSGGGNSNGGGSGSGGSGNGDSGNSGTNGNSGNGGSGNISPNNPGLSQSNSQENTAPQGNNAPYNNNAPQNSQFANAASPLSFGQGASIGATGQSAPPGLSRAPDGGLIVGSSTIAPGQVATINNHQISVGPDHVAVDANTYAFVPPAAATPGIVTVAGLPVQSAANGGAVIAGSTYAPGAQITQAGHTISVGSGNVVVDGNNQVLPTPAPAALPPVMVGGSTVQRGSDGAVVVGGSTFAVGAQASVNGHAISVGANNVVVDGTTNAVPIPAPTAPSAPIFINGQQVSRASDGAVVVGSSTIAVGAQASVNGHAISVGATNVVVDGTTNALPTPAPTAPSVPVLINGQEVQRAPDGGVIFGTATIPPGAQTSVGGHLISAGPSNVVVDGVTSALPSYGAHPASSPIFVNGQQMQRAPDGGVLLGSVSLAPGAQTSIGGHSLSIGSTNVIVDGVTSTLPSPGTTPTTSPLLINGQQMQRAPDGGLIVGSITIPPGAQITIAGHTISIGVSSVLLDGNTYALPTTAGAILLTTANPSSGPQRTAITLPNGSILSAGGVATISGQVVSVLPNDQGVVIGGSTIPFASTSSVFTVGGQTFTAAPTGFVIAGTTLMPGGSAVTISGTVVSLGPSGSLKIGSSTIPLASASATGLGGFIASAFDAPVAPAGTAAVNGAKATGVKPFMGSASKVKGDGWILLYSTLTTFLMIAYGLRI